MKNKYIWLGIILLIILAALFAWPKFTNPYREKIKKWNDLGIECLISGHQNISLHIHPKLTIVVDGAKQTIPSEIGIVRDCMAEIHTHDASGTIHIESVSEGRKFKLNDFFAVWGESMDKLGYKLEITVDGAPSSLLGELIMTDKQQITLKYSK